MTFQQDTKLIEKPLAMQRCDHIGICADAVYDPASSHIPRGFSGAEGSLDDVLLVMVFAEPAYR